MGSNAQKQGRTFWREFLCLWAIAVAFTALSLSLNHFPLAGLARQLSIPFHTQSTVSMLIAVIAQSSIHLAISIGVGLVAAHQVGLGAPVLKAWLRGEPISSYLRTPVLPIFLAALLVAACALLANSSVFYPNRRLDAIRATEILNSPAGAKVGEAMDKLGMVGEKPLTPTSLALSYLTGAIDGELTGRLFEVSVIVLLLVQIFGERRTFADRRLFWAAVLMVALIHTANYVLVRHENTVMVSQLVRELGVQLRVDPFWLIAVRTSVRIVPSGLALGLLYVRYGIESSIVGSFGALVIAHLFANFWLIHFGLQL